MVLRKQYRMWSRRCLTVWRGSLQQARPPASLSFSLRRCPMQLCLTSQPHGRPRVHPRQRSAHQNTYCGRVEGAAALSALVTELPVVCCGCGGNRSIAVHCRPVEAGSDKSSASGAVQPDRELPTAFVQDMLMTDPVQALGLRVMHAPGATLEFVSLEEAKTELSAASYWHKTYYCSASCT